MPIGPARMPLFDHLGELRMRLVRIVACLAVAVVVFYMATPTMGQFLLMPIAEFLPNVDGNGLASGPIDPFEAFSDALPRSRCGRASCGHCPPSFCGSCSRSSCRR